MRSSCLVVSRDVVLSMFSHVCNVSVNCMFLPGFLSYNDMNTSAIKPRWFGCILLTYWFRISYSHSYKIEDLLTYSFFYLYFESVNALNTSITNILVNLPFVLCKKIVFVLQYSLASMN